VTITFHGFNTHPGYAKGRMGNAIKVASAFVDSPPPDRLSPEPTGGRDGFVHPYVVQASVDKTSVKLIVRDFVTSGLKEKEATLTALADAAAARFPGTRVEVLVEEQYRNMKEILDGRKEIV